MRSEDAYGAPENTVASDQSAGEAALMRKACGQDHQREDCDGDAVRACVAQAIAPIEDRRGHDDDRDRQDDERQRASGARPAIACGGEILIGDRRNQQRCAGRRRNIEGSAGGSIDALEWKPEWRPARSTC
jgi:hypothetical protein